ncbi:Gfo/Idh/MocA family oxidoreductase [Phytoactinopolyspora alkaliphila]|uniref:Gfo/Idh/MocA family oxidoreductase n=1 Tax=Phytoactinopolyspora alkaliphila TaxID=1783498 RepID=A0A6N9YPE7_9ACTN|nr:Gfo/Idh/MocA family oxidoreductase [Phytoactinopolyspora alkaliphila]NED96873.1 Gfo/Idh/MocA family oxidoreductase [Phytoactinopolyspora alkaliphila]
MIRVGVVGGSGVGAAHVAALRMVDGVRVEAVTGSTQQSAERAARSLDVPASFVDARHMIESGLVDAVHICTPNHLHGEAVRGALSNSLHVVCEKPLTSAAAQAVELEAVAKVSTASSTVCYQYRYSPLIAEFTDFVATGKLGSVHSIRAAYLQNWQLGGAASWRDDAARAGASRVLADIGTHLMDLVETVSGEPMASLNADFLTDRDGRPRGRDDAAVAMARLDSGALVAITASQVSPGHMNTIIIEVDGDDGTIRWELSDRETLELVHAADARPLRLNRHANPHVVSRVWRARLDPDERLGALFRAFYEPLLGRAEHRSVPLPGFHEAARHVRLIESAAAGLTSLSTPEELAAG